MNYFRLIFGPVQRDSLQTDSDAYEPTLPTVQNAQVGSENKITERPCQLSEFTPPHLLALH